MKQNMTAVTSAAGAPALRLLRASPAFKQPVPLLLLSMLHSCSHCELTWPHSIILAVGPALARTSWTQGCWSLARLAASSSIAYHGCSSVLQRLCSQTRRQRGN